MTSAQYLALKSLETKKRKAHQLAYKTDDQEDRIYNLDPNMTNANYINAFNVYMHRLKDLEYKTKNPELFTWRQNIKYMNKLKMPQLFLDQELNRRFKKDTTDKKMLRTASEHAIAVHHGTSENAFTPRKSFAQSVNKVRALIKPFGTVRSVPERDENPLRKRGSEPITAEAFDMSKLDLSAIQRNKRSFSISKLQTSLLSHRTSSVPEIQNIQYMQDQFNRKNTQINKILCQINPKLELLDKEQIQKDTVKKIQDHTQDYKLHQFLHQKEKSLRSLSPKRSATTVKKRPNSTSRQQSNPDTAIPKEVLPKILSILKGQESLNIPKQTSKNATNEDDKEKDHQNVSQSDREKTVHISLRNLLDFENKSKKRKAFLVNNEKPKPKSLVKKVGQALDKLDEILNISTQSPDEHTTTNQRSKNNFLHPNYNMSTERISKNSTDRRKSRETSSFDPENLLKNSSSSTPKHSGNRSIANSTDNSPTYLQTDRSPANQVPVDKDNILNYKVYFKQKYQEKGTSLEFSNQLNKKLKAVAKDVDKAMKNH